MFVDPTCTRIGVAPWSGWRTNSGQREANPATALLVSGEFLGEWNTEYPMTVTADGALLSPVTVTVSVSGGTSTFDPATAVLSSGGSVEFGVTPTSVGTLTYTFSAPGLVSATLDFVAENPAPALPDLTTLVRIEANPLNAFESSQGTTGSGVVAHSATTSPYSPALEAKNGLTNKIKGAVTLANDPNRDYQANLWQTYTSGPITDMTATQYMMGVEDPNYAMLSRVADPLDGAKWVYRHEGDKTKIGFSGSSVKWRSFIQSTDDTFRFDPWGSEHWVAAGYILDADWLNAVQGPYYLLLAWHDGPGGLTGGAAFQVGIRPGAGNPSAMQLEIDLKRYNQTDPANLANTWPRKQASKDKKTYSTVTNISGGIPTGQKFWLVMHLKTGNGFADYPGYVPGSGSPGSPVWGTYGSTDPLDPFVELYYALGDADPALVYRWDDAYAKTINSSLNGFWGSPHATTETATEKQRAGYVQCGLYTSSHFEPVSQIGNVQGFYSKGYQHYRARDIWRVSPGVYDSSRASALSVLTAFRTAR